AKAIPDVVLARKDAGLGVDAEHDDVGLFDRRLGLATDARLDLAGAVVEATGVDQRELTTAPLDRRVDAIPRRAGLVLDDRHALADEAIEEGGLADIGTADHGNETTAHPHTLRRSQELTLAIG